MDLPNRADRSVPAPTPPPDLAASARLRASRRTARIRLTLRAAAIIAIAAVLTAIILPRNRKPDPDLQLAALQDQFRQLQSRTDAAIDLIHEVISREQKQQRLEALEAELLQRTDPVEDIDRRLDKTATLLLRQAERLHTEFDQTNSAIAAYKRVILLSPESPAAEVAAQRISQLQNSKTNHIIPKEI